jgi:hypothetical protein
MNSDFLSLIPRINAQKSQSYYLNFCVFIRKNIFNLLDDVEISKIELVWQEAFNTDFFDFDPVLIHADLDGKHVFVSNDSDNISGVIDWGDSVFSDAAYEFARILNSLGPLSTKRILSSYFMTYKAGHEEAFIKRLLFYSKTLPFNRIVGGLHDGNQQKVELGLALPDKRRKPADTADRTPGDAGAHRHFQRRVYRRAVAAAADAVDHVVAVVYALSAG